MWVEGGDIHDELLDQLGGVLAPPEDLALTPSTAELEMLAAAVAVRWPDGSAAPAAAEGEGSPGGTPALPGSPVRSIRSGSGRSLRRLGSGAWRAGSVAAGLVLVSASAAAAANGGVPLPDPVRVVAYTVGLPVDSPALHETHQDIKELKKAVEANDTPKAEAKARELVHKDLPKVPADEKVEAKTKVDAAIAESVPKMPSLAASTVTTTTTVPPPTTTTEPAPSPSTTATTLEVKRNEKPKEKEKDREKPSGATKTTEATTTTTGPEPTTTTTAPPADENPSGGAGGDGGSIGTDPAPTTTTTVPEPTTTTTTGPPPEETTTTTTTAPPTTTTTAPTTQPAVVEGKGE